MFGLKSKTTQNTPSRAGRPQKVNGQYVTYKPVAVSPAAHAKLKEIARRRDSSIVDTIDIMLGL